MLMKPTFTRTTISAAVTAALLLPRFVIAQPAPGAPGAGSAAPVAGSSQDEPLYNCGKNKTKEVVWNLKPETELKDLITWVMAFTCRNFILDPRIVSTGKKVTIIAPVKMTPAEAYNVFLAALSTMGLTVIPKGDR